MKEHNKKTLIESLSTLPEHEPPAQVWESIQHGMELELGELISPKMLAALPQHAPPAVIWGQIAQKLGRDKKVLLSIPWKKGLAIAASLALLVFSVWKLNPGQAPNDGSSISYTTEPINPVLLQNDWDEDEDAFNEFLEICQEKKSVCERPEFMQLQSELEELTLAKEELKTAIGGYGAAPYLVTQIKEIELERTDILKKMMVMLI